MSTDSTHGPLGSPRAGDNRLKRVGILFAGGPAPAANAVISTAAASFVKNGIEVIGILHGYSWLTKYSPEDPPREGEHYRRLTAQSLRRTRSSQGIMLGTARENPGQLVKEASDLHDREKTAPLRRVYEGLCSLGIDALVSVGGDDTLKSANMLHRYQETLPADSKHIAVVHLPKTIDNDYFGIDFTFGYFTAVDFLATEVRNLLYDAEANNTYFIAETMGRSAGWLAYGAAIAGEASLVMSVEDITGEYEALELASVDSETGERWPDRRVMNLNAVLDRIVDTIATRASEGKRFGVIVMAEGLAELLPLEQIKRVGRDPHGHLHISQVQMYRLFAEKITERYEERFAGKKPPKVIGIQLGYEARCARPSAFDVILGSQLGVGAYRALVEQGLDAHMVSVERQLDLHNVPFDELIDPVSLKTKVRRIDTESDFHRLARFLETFVRGADAAASH